MTAATAQIDAALSEKGWAVVDLPAPEAAFAARDGLLDRLRSSGLPDLSSLSAYHEHAAADEDHFARIWSLCQWYWKEELGWAILNANLDLFRELLGPDLHGQRYPYLRVVRPGITADAAPMHRDTYYGASPYELSILTPFTDMEESAGLRVVTGSHLDADHLYPYVQHRREDVEPGSPKHQLGYPYAPRLLEASLLERAEAVPLRVGQAAIFGLSLVHGGGVNQGAGTRFSTDIRVANSLAPVQWQRGVRKDYFVPLCSSAISRTAAVYERANRQD